MLKALAAAGIALLSAGAAAQTAAPSAQASPEAAEAAVARAEAPVRVVFRPPEQLGAYALDRLFDARRTAPSAVAVPRRPAAPAEPFVEVGPAAPPPAAPEAFIEIGPPAPSPRRERTLAPVVELPAHPALLVPPPAPALTREYRRAFGVFLANPAATDRYDALILQYSQKYRLNPRLLKGIIAAESEFVTRATSPHGAIGLMQLMRSTARNMGAEEGRLEDPEENIKAGAAYLGHLFARAWKLFKLDPRLAFSQAPLWLVQRVIAAYNAGPRFLARQAIYQETRAYITKVLLFMRSPVSLLRWRPAAQGTSLSYQAGPAGLLQ